MKAFLFTEFGHWMPYDKNLDGSFKFLYYVLPGENILMLVSTWHKGELAHSDLHEKSAISKKPVGAGLFCAQRKAIEDWESFTMKIVTPEEYRPEITGFLSH